MSTLVETRVHGLHPTQITVGMIEVHDKIQVLEGLGKHERRDFLAARPLPAVRGANDILYITDHHHLGRALVETGIEHAFIETEASMTALDGARFWQTMAEAHWAHPIDEQGVRRPFSDIPGSLHKLRDDVYRSLAGYVRDAGGYDKTPTAFAEFAWANWLRTRVEVGPDHDGFKRAVKQALDLAHSPDARHLPGYRGA
jgi:hypothetical protein